MCVYEIYFSPTGGTKKVANIVAKGIGGEVIAVDLIKHPEKLHQIEFAAEDVCLVAVPSYGGRVPTVVVDEFKKIKGNGAKTVLIAVFGNRDIDDTLTELQDVLAVSGFCCVAGMEAVAEHSLMHQSAAGRPDLDDEKILMSFAKEIKEKLAHGTHEANLKLPGSHDYKEYNGVPLKPKANRKCISCGLCAKKCPAGAIPKDNPRMTDREKCISCMHCVSVCPKNARHYSKLLSMIAGQKMKKTCAERKENKLYI